MLGVPVRQPEFVVAELTAKAEEHASLFEKITHIPDVQIGWLPPDVLCRHEGKLLAPHSVSRVDRRVCEETRPRGSPVHVQVVAGGADSLSQCVGHCTHAFKSWRTCSWADCLEMIAQRHPPVAQAIVNTASAAIARLQDVGVEIERDRLRPITTSANFDFGQFDLDVKFWDDKGWRPAEGWGPEGWSPWNPEGWGPEG